ncbi:MAG: helix-turn-helix transcriptional regulator [Planctomycetota bacterium]|jgi:hypothetical protein
MDNVERQTMIEPVLVGIEDAASMLGISPSTFKQLDRKGGIGPVPVRIQTIKRTLYRVDELRAWALAGCPIREKWQRLKELS